MSAKAAMAEAPTLAAPMPIRSQTSLARLPSSDIASPNPPAPETRRVNWWTSSPAPTISAPMPVRISAPRRTTSAVASPRTESAAAASPATQRPARNPAKAAAVLATRPTLSISRTSASEMPVKMRAFCQRGHGVLSFELEGAGDHVAPGAGRGAAPGLRVMGRDFRRRLGLGVQQRGAHRLKARVLLEEAAGHLRLAGEAAEIDDGPGMGDGLGADGRGVRARAGICRRAVRIVRLGLRCGIGRRRDIVDVFNDVGPRPGVVWLDGLVR